MENQLKNREKFVRHLLAARLSLYSLFAVRSGNRRSAFPGRLSKVLPAFWRRRRQRQRPGQLIGKAGENRIHQKQLVQLGGKQRPLGIHRRQQLGDLLKLQVLFENRENLLFTREREKHFFSLPCRRPAFA